MAGKQKQLDLGVYVYWAFVFTVLLCLPIIGLIFLNNKGLFFFLLFSSRSIMDHEVLYFSYDFLVGSSFLGLIFNERILLQVCLIIRSSDRFVAVFVVVDGKLPFRIACVWWFQSQILLFLGHPGLCWSTYSSYFDFERMM